MKNSLTILLVFISFGLYSQVAVIGPGGFRAGTTATTNQALIWNGSAWVPGTIVNTEAQTLSRSVSTNNIVTISVTGSTINVEDLNVTANATFTPANFTATTGLTLPTENSKIRLTRNGILYVVGAAGCGACNATRSGSVFTFARALVAGEIITVTTPQQ